MKIETEIMKTFGSEDEAKIFVEKSLHWEPNLNVFQYKDNKLKQLTNIDKSKKMKLVRNVHTDNVIFIWG